MSENDRHGGGTVRGFLGELAYMAQDGAAGKVLAGLFVIVLVGVPLLVVGVVGITVLEYPKPFLYLVASIVGILVVAYLGGAALERWAA